MLAGVWVSNGARRGGGGGSGSCGGSAGFGRSRLPSATRGRSRVPGQARRSGGHGFWLLGPEAPAEEMTVRDLVPYLLQRLNLHRARTSLA
ncbi:hypothetical protein VULLAG_LOCUS20237 [Vulpes lagopus]